MRAFVPTTVLLLVAMTSSCTDDEPDAAEATTTTEQRVEFCDAYEVMLEAQQEWTVEYLNGLTAEEREANRAEQDDVAAPVRELMPALFVDEWDEVEAVWAVVEAEVDEISPADGTTEQLLRDVQALGFGSLTEYVMRDGLEVDGTRWTFDSFAAAGAEQTEQIEAYCADPT